MADGDQEEKPWYSGIVSTAENFIAPAAHVAEDGIEIAAHGAQSAFEAAGATAEEAEALAPGLGEVGEVLPGIGAALGVGQAAYHGYEAANTTGTEHWNQTGEATLGGINAAASFCPEAGLYVGAGELAINGAGALSHMLGGPDFNAGSVVGGIEHGVSDAAHWVGDLF